MSLKSSIRQRVPIALDTYHLTWAWSGAKRYGHPSKKIFVIGVTGTKGKTTTLDLLNAILEAAGKRTAVLSSLRMKIGDDVQKNKTGNSMPGRGYIQKFLHRAVKANCAYALVEVTSQGVAAYRHRFIDWNIGVLTNLAPEHIESHGSFERYRDAKLSFLTYVVDGGGMVLLNRADEHFDFFSKALANKKIADYSRHDEWFSEYLPKESATRAAAGDDASHFMLSDFNRDNIACAIAVAKEIGVGDEIIKQALMDFRGVPGRMNFVHVGGYTAVVDYAHTPGSLEAVYRNLKELIAAQDSSNLNAPSSKLICVLGAAVRRT